MWQHHCRLAILCSNIHPKQQYTGSFPPVSSTSLLHIDDPVVAPPWRISGPAICRSTSNNVGSANDSGQMDERVFVFVCEIDKRWEGKKRGRKIRFANGNTHGRTEMATLASWWRSYCKHWRCSVVHHPTWDPRLFKTHNNSDNNCICGNIWKHIWMLKYFTVKCATDWWLVCSWATTRKNLLVWRLKYSCFSHNICCYRCIVFVYYASITKRSETPKDIKPVRSIKLFKGLRDKPFFLTNKPKKSGVNLQNIVLHLV